MENNERPLILAIDEFEKKLTQLINTSNLPASFVEPAIYKVLVQLQELKSKEIQNVIDNYNNKKKEVEA